MREMSRIVRTVSHIMFPFVIMFGFYLVVHGHLTPGGGFQGGAIIASGLALLIVAYSRSRVKKVVKKEVLTTIESSGLLMFIGLAFLGIGATFFYNFLANSGIIFGDSVAYGINPGNLNTAGTLPLMSIAVGLEVLAGLSIIILMLAIGSLAGEGSR
ncbi:MAG: sodium:proton antiporter [Candidatus Diapherotrites archaeon]|nr:sodium:proton antiporter [Candidatus Diapherotrites archaeon]